MRNWARVLPRSCGKRPACSLGTSVQVVDDGGGGPGLSLAGSKALLAAIYFDPARSTDAAGRAQFALSMSKGDGWTIDSLFSNRTLSAESVDDKLGAITVPTLVIWGAGDRIVPLDDGRDFAARIPGARLVIVRDSGHAPEIEKPREFLEAMEPFIDHR